MSEWRGGGAQQHNDEMRYAHSRFSRALYIRVSAARIDVLRVGDARCIPYALMAARCRLRRMMRLPAAVIFEEVERGGRAVTATLVLLSL